MKPTTAKRTPPGNPRRIWTIPGWRMEQVRGVRALQPVTRRTVAGAAVDRRRHDEYLGAAVERRLEASAHRLPRPADADCPAGLLVARWTLGLRRLRRHRRRRRHV